MSFDPVEFDQLYTQSQELLERIRSQRQVAQQQETLLQKRKQLIQQREEILFRLSHFDMKSDEGGSSM